MGFHWENGNYYIVYLGYRDNGKENVLGLYTDNGKENGNYYSEFWAFPLSKREVREHNILVCLRCWELLASINMMMVTVMVARSVHQPVCDWLSFVCATRSA